MNPGKTRSLGPETKDLEENPGKNRILGSETKDLEENSEKKKRKVGPESQKFGR